ncbi:uncharacterized protein LOC141910814 [Tubulanus polymorphus]|uniref:uncharacterized protein LOC141910814 n=1 Tax=Tubulanus polymorphus TaxID=672921 RepID=UPI003DA3A9F0
MTPQPTKQQEFILGAIDQLRNRKARPDLEHISRFVQRRYGLSFVDTQNAIESLVSLGLAIKVDYKGSASYRNAAKWKKKYLSADEKINSTQTRSDLYQAIKAIVSDGKVMSVDDDGGDAIGSDPPDAGPDRDANRHEEEIGASYSEIEQWLEGNAESSSWLKTHLSMALAREVESGNIERLANDRYVLRHDELPATPSAPPTTPPPAAEPDKPLQTIPAADDSIQQLEMPPTTANTAFKRKLTTGKKGRPLGSGKKKKLINLKKNGEVSGKIVPSQLPENLPATVDTGEDKCRLCFLTAECNRFGVVEQMLTCSDCQTEVHPTCMNYSEDLARRARDSPWQCYDCKTCCICSEAGDAAELLFCDACDKGYHMQCHEPKIDENPTGQWVCKNCSELGCDLMETTDSNGAASSSCLLTPCDSPTNFQIKNNSVEARPEQKFIDELLNRIDVERLRHVSIADWSIDDVAEFIAKVGFTVQAENFRDQEIDGKSLLLMKRNDVLTGLSLKLGPALKIYDQIVKIQMAAGGGIV